MASTGIVVLGIPLPSDNPVFLALVAIHIAFGLTAVIAGILAMLAPKGRGRHSRRGTVYFWALAGVFLTVSALSFVRWTEDFPLFFLGATSFGTALIAKWAIRRGMVRLHLSSMGMSYVAMLTAFYVDNGKNLPLWRDLPQLAFWILPAAIGAPVIAYYLFRLPASSVNRR
jgi:uncharacterized membrane protein